MVDNSRFRLHHARQKELPCSLSLPLLGICTLTQTVVSTGCLRKRGITARIHATRSSKTVGNLVLRRMTSQRNPFPRCACTWLKGENGSASCVKYLNQN